MAPSWIDMTKLQRHQRYLANDVRGELGFLIRTAIIACATFYWTAYNRMKCLIIGIGVARKTAFVGNCIFDRHQMSTIQIGERCRFASSTYYNLIGVNHNCVLSTHSETARIDIGSNCGFSGTVIGAFASIRIGDNVRCGANTVLTDADWHLDDPRSGKPRDVVIGDNVWLGVNVVVLKGVTIGDNTLVGANSVVTNSIPANVVAAGSPCKVINALEL